MSDDKPKAAALVSYTMDELAVMTREAETALSSPAMLKAETMVALVVHAKILDGIIRKPPPGRPGLIALLKAVPLYRETMGTVLGVLAKKTKPGTPPALPEGHVEAEARRSPRGDGGEPGSPDRSGPAGEADPSVDG